MGWVDTSKAEPIVRRTNDGPTPYGRLFRGRMTPKCRWYFFMRTRVLPTLADAQVNPDGEAARSVLPDAAAVKALATELGAEIVGIAAYDPRIRYQDAGVLDHKSVIVFGKAMAYDTMVDIGASSQEEVHRVYFELDEIGVRLAARLGAMGYSARAHSNTGDFPLPAYGYLAGLGELGKHGSLISPELGSSFRLTAVSTSMEMEIDGPRDYGMEEVCLNCELCTRFCPGDAITPKKRTVAGIERWHVDSDKCQPWFSKLYGCKICLSVCPLTAKVPELRANYKKLSKAMKEAKDGLGMVDLIDRKHPLDLEAFNEIPYRPEEFGGPFIKEAREQRNSRTSSIIFDEDESE